MTAIYLRKVAQGFAPDTDKDWEAASRFKLGEVTKAEVTKPRNYAHHKKLMALCQLIAENSEVYDTTEKALTGLKIVTGHVDFVPHPGTGELVAVPKSINYSSMDQIAFTEWYDKAVAAACKYMVPQMTKMDAEHAMEMVSGW